MSIPLPNAVAKGDPDAVALFLSRNIGVTLKTDNELALWGEQPLPQPVSDATVAAQANSVLAAADAATFLANVRKKKVTK